MERRRIVTLGLNSNAQAVDERQILADVPNALGYHRAFETSSNGYLVRQYVYSSLYDRMRSVNSTGPEVTLIEIAHDLFLKVLRNDGLRFSYSVPYATATPETFFMVISRLKILS